MDTFGKRLKHLIKTSEIKTVKSFAERVGMNDVSISRIITGRNNPSYELIEACVKNFSDTEIIWLLSGRDFNDEIALKNKQLEESATFYKKKYQKAKNSLENLVKDSSNCVNPQQSLPGFEVEKAQLLA